MECMPQELVLDLAPLDGDPKDLGIENGARVWGALSCDPAFVAAAPAGESLAPGWHRASAEIDCLSGDIRDPELFLPDASGRFVQSVSLVRDGPAYRAEFFLPHAVQRVRFDPSRYPCEFACNGLRVAALDAPRPAPPRIANALRAPAARLRRLAQAMRQRTQRAHNAATALSPAALAERRKERVLASIDRNGAGLEIGPSHSPIAPKREGFNVQVIDHASREELLHKYAQHGVALDRIEEVDFVWRGQSYAELTGKPKHYDWIIASHLIEHTPDLIAFLGDCDAILKEGGVLSLVIPDKRYTFDRFRPITGLARIIDAHLAGNRIHSAGASAEYFMNVAGKAHQLSWQAGAQGEYVFIHSASYARDMIREVREKGSYLDIHNWCFVPHSFRLLLADLYALGYTKLREVGFHDTDGCEFFVTLGRHGKGPPLSRMDLLREIDRELSPEGP